MHNVTWMSCPSHCFHSRYPHLPDVSLFSVSPEIQQFRFPSKACRQTVLSPTGTVLSLFGTMRGIWTKLLSNCPCSPHGSCCISVATPTTTHTLIPLCLHQAVGSSAPNLARLYLYHAQQRFVKMWVRVGLAAEMCAGDLKLSIRDEAAL